MITKFKIFENITYSTNNIPKKGDYVLINCNQNNYLTLYNMFKNFIDNNIGQIISAPSTTSTSNIIVKYENIPNEIKDWFTVTDNNISYRIFSTHEIIACSDNKDDLMVILQTKKYNL